MNKKLKLIEVLDDDTIKDLGYDPELLTRPDDKKPKSEHGKVVSEKNFLKGPVVKSKIKVEQKHDKSNGKTTRYSQVEVLVIDTLRKIRRKIMGDEKKVPIFLPDMILQTIIDICQGKLAESLIAKSIIKNADDLKENGHLRVLGQHMRDYIQETYWPKGKKIGNQFGVMKKIFEAFSQPWCPIFLEKRQAKGKDARGNPRKGLEYIINSKFIAEIAHLESITLLRDTPGLLKSKYDKSLAEEPPGKEEEALEAAALTPADQVISLPPETGAQLKALVIKFSPQGGVRKIVLDFQNSKA